MKNLYNTLIILFFIGNIFLPGYIFAQSNMTIGGNGELSIPLGDFSDVANIGFGASGRFQYILKQNIAFTGVLGYLKWGSKEIDTGFFGAVPTKYSAFAIKPGLQYYLNSNINRPYAVVNLIYTRSEQKFGEFQQVIPNLV